MKKGVYIPVCVFALLILTISLVILIQIQGANPSATLPRNSSSLASTRPPTDIDVVYTWVDSSDPEWRARRDALTRRKIRAQLITHSHRWPVLTQDLSELAISVKSVRAFMPWVRNIYVVTERPQKIDDPGLIFVHHDQIMTPSNLPTFNSQAIETGLHNIPGLAEHFIYFNDDMFVAQPVTPGDFFIEDKPVFRTGNKKTNWARNSPLAKHFMKKCVGTGPATVRMKKVMGGKVYTTDHQAIPLTRTLMAVTEAKYKPHWDRTQTFAFRDDTNVAPVTMALNHGLRTRGVHVLRDDRLRSDASEVANVRKVRTRDTLHMFCIHDLTTERQLRELNDYIDARIDKFIDHAPVR